MATQVCMGERRAKQAWGEAVPTVRELIAELARTEEALSASRLDPLTPERLAVRRAIVQRQGEIVAELRRRRSSTAPAA